MLFKIKPYFPIVHFKDTLQQYGSETCRYFLKVNRTITATRPRLRGLRPVQTSECLRAHSSLSTAVPLAPSGSKQAQQLGQLCAPSRLPISASLLRFEENRQPAELILLSQTPSVQNHLLEEIYLQPQINTQHRVLTFPGMRSHLTPTSPAGGSPGSPAACWFQLSSCKLACWSWSLRRHVCLTCAWVCVYDFAFQSSA